MSENEETVYLIRSKAGGFANDVTVCVEGGNLLYHVKAKAWAPLGRVYTVQDASMKELWRTQQKHTAIFPCHTIYEDTHCVGTLGQVGLIPRNYFIHIHNSPRAEVHVGGYDSIYRLQTVDQVIAEIAQFRSTWIVVLSTQHHRSLLLAAIAVLYRQDTITG